MISQRTIEEVFSTARIEDVVGDFLNLRKKGANMVGLCPFHDEKTPSFMVSPTKNIYKCFGCGRGGGAVQFVMEHERYSYPEAIRYLAKKYQIEIEETERSQEEVERMHEAESMHLINQFATEHFNHNLFETEEGRSIGLAYFKERGYREGILKRFEVGYSMPGGSVLKERALSNGFSEERLAVLGLITQKGNDFFRGRVMFPIHNLSGKVIGFGGRTLRTGKRDPKYINSIESTVYNKRKILYGLHQAKSAIRKLDMCYLVEGYTDVLSLAQSGIEHVVSSSGTALTKDQIKAIKRFTQNIIVLYDGDPAGVKAAMRGLDLLLEEDMFVRLVLLPDNHDPDSLLRKLGQQAFQEFIDTEAKDFILFKADFLSEESANDPIRKSQVIKDIVSSVAIVPDPIRRAMYLQECARLLTIDENILIQETHQVIKSNLKRERLQNKPREIRSDFQEMQSVETKKTARPADGAVRYSDEYQEIDVVRILVQFGDKEYSEGTTVAEYVLTNIEDVIDTFDNPIYSVIISYYLESLKENRIPSSSELLQLPDPGVADLIVEILAPPFEYSENWMKLKQMPLVTQKDPEENYVNDSYESILRFKLRKIERKIQENKALIVKYDAAGDDENRDLHLQVHRELQKIKMLVGEELNTIGIRL